MNKPQYNDTGVIGLVPNQWDSYWRLFHQILYRLPKYFHVVWMSPTKGWRTNLRNLQNYKFDQFRKIDSSELVIYTPGTLKTNFGRPKLLRNLTMSLRLRKAKNYLLKAGCRKIILYIWRPEFYYALDLVEYDLSCYHIGDEYTFSKEDVPVPRTERKLLKQVNQVFIHSPALIAKKGMYNKNTKFIPNGVDYDAYSAIKPEPEDLKRIPHPRIGYTGIIKDQLDWALISNLIKSNPKWNFIFVGPINQNHTEVVKTCRQLSEIGNVHFLGGKTVQELAAYPQHFDVCIMPYNVDGYTKYINPLKLYEYLASGKSAVGSNIETLLGVSDLITLPKSYSQWSIAIRNAMRPEFNDANAVNKRKEFAYRHDWNILVEEIAKTMIRRLNQIDSKSKKKAQIN